MLKNKCQKKNLWKEGSMSVKKKTNKQLYIIRSKLGLGQLKNRNVLKG